MFQSLINAEWEVQTEEDFAAYRPDCVRMLHVPVEKVNEYKMNNFPNDKKTQCYVKCMLEKLGVFDDREGFYVDRLVAQLEKDRKRGIDTKAEIEKCADENPQKTGPCEWAYRVFHCIRPVDVTLRL